MSTERQLTKNERKTIRKLVINICANYDKNYGCLPLDSECYMLNKMWTGAYCNYFLNVILPLDPALTASLSNSSNKKLCGFCGNLFIAKGKQKYCSSYCAIQGQRIKQKNFMRKKRNDS